MAARSDPLLVVAWATPMTVYALVLFLAHRGVTG